MSGLAIIVLLAVSLIGSGFLFSHRRFLTYIATAGVLFEVLWLLVTLFEREVSRGAFGAVAVLGLVGLVALVSWRGFIMLAKSAGGGDSKMWLRGFHWGKDFRENIVEYVRRDIPTVIVLVIVLAAAWSVGRVNGYQESDASWRAHGFYNGDTMTLMALVNRSYGMLNLVESNPWAENMDLEYPTLLHAGVANFFLAFHDSYDWEFFLPLTVLVQIFLTVPLFFLLWDLVWPEPRVEGEKWLGVPRRPLVWAAQAGIALYVIGLSWDNYIYPQSHFYLTGLFLLAAALLIRGYKERGLRQLTWAGLGFVIAGVLLMSNAVTGTAAIAAASVFSILRILDEARPRGERGGYLIVLAGLIGAFLLFPPGEASFSVPTGFSYTAVGEIARYAPILVILLVGLWQYFPRQIFLSASVVLLMLMAFFTFVFSGREIVSANAARFIYHAVLLGFPLLLPPLIQAVFWLRRELKHTTHPLAEMLTGYGALLVGLALVLWPVLGSVASAHDNLMRKDEQIVSFAERAALEWVRYNTDPDAVFLTYPDPPFVIPQFTGRSMTRANYWLSRDDEVLENVNRIFTGDFSVWDRLQAHTEFVYIKKEDKAKWDTLGLTEIIDNGVVVIYKVK